MQGTSSRVAGRPRPQYPHPINLLYSLWRVVVVCLASFLLHHFITTTLITPFIFNIVKSNFVQTYIKNGLILRWLTERTSVGSWLQANNQTIDDALLYVIGTTTIHACVYVPLNGFFALCDHFKWLQYYRIPVEKRAVPSSELIRATLIDAFITFFFSGPITLMTLFIFPGKHWRGYDSPTEMNNWQSPFYTQIAIFIGALFFNEIMFYLAHRFVHEFPGAYKLIHSQHHRYIGAVSISAEYAHPVEALFANFLPTSLFMALMSRHGVPVSAWYTWLYVRLIETFEAHSGYDFRTTILYELGILHGSCAWHYNHHVQNRGNYGGFLMDYLGGTMDGWLTDSRRLKAPAEIDAEKLASSSSASM